MDDLATRHRHLLHQVNNLLAVIQTQMAVADAVATHDAARDALRHIGESAERLMAEVRALRAAERQE